MRISELVKTYRLLNDPHAPPWNVKFVGALALVGLVAAAAGGLYWVTRTDEAPQASAGSAVASRARDETAAAPLPAGTLRDYVGFAREAPPADPLALDAALMGWKAAHPGAVILSQDAVLSDDGRVAGYEIVYRP